MSDVTDNCKKVKRNNFDKKLDETSSASIIVAHDTNNTKNNPKSNSENNTNKQQSKSTSATKSSEISKNDKNPPKHTSASTNISNPPLVINQKYVLTQAIHNTDDVQLIGSQNEQTYLKENSASLNVPQSNENSVACKNMVGYVALPKDNQVYMQSNLCIPINNFYLQDALNKVAISTEQNIEQTDKTNIYAVPSSNVFLSNMADNITVHQTANQLIVNQPIIGLTTPIPNNNQTATVKQQKSVPKRILPAPSTPNLGNSSSNKSYVSNSLRTVLC